MASKKPFTVLILAANDWRGVETLKAIHFMANGVRDLSEKKIEIAFDNLYGDGAYKARGGELAGIIPGHVQVFNLIGDAHRAEAVREAWLS